MNYARYTPVYDTPQCMFQRCDSWKPHSQKCSSFWNGVDFVVRRSNKSKFNSVPTDQALEQSINRNAKTTGGIIGFTRRKATLLRWLVTRHSTAQYSESFEQLCDGISQDRIHDEVGKTRLARDRTDKCSPSLTS